MKLAETRSSKGILVVILDHQLAQLGDSLVNFVYSLALTRRYGKPMGKKISDSVLAEAARMADLRRLLPRRTSKGDVANSVEALLVHVWLNQLITIDEMSTIIQRTEQAPVAFAELAKIALQKLGGP